MVSRMAKSLTHHNTDAIRRSLSSAGRELLETARAQADRRALELWAVGGTVRDAATARQVIDVDVAVNREASELAAAVAEQHGGSWSAEERFGTASVTVGADRLDIATLRTERYAEPGALPDVSLGATIEADLERRDFSVNAIAIALTGPRRDQVVDPFGGFADLERRRFRVLHARSFEDDATRIWRAARLSVAHNLRPTAETADLLVRGARQLDTISGDRLWSEFALIAERGRSGRTLDLLDRWRALEATSPALTLTDDSRATLRHRWRPMPVERLATVLLAMRPAEPAEAVLVRLNAPTTAIRAVRDARTLLNARANYTATPDRLESLASTDLDGRAAAIWLDGGQGELQRELRRWERTRPHLLANDLLATGVPEGPEVGELLRCLRRGRYLGTLGSVAAARALVRRHLDGGSGADDQ